MRVVMSKFFFCLMLTRNRGIALVSTTDLEATYSSKLDVRFGHGHCEITVAERKKRREEDEVNGDYSVVG